MILDLPDPHAEFQAVQVVEYLAEVVFPVVDALLLEKLDTHHLEEDLVGALAALAKA